MNSVLFPVKANLAVSLIVTVKFTCNLEIVRHVLCRMACTVGPTMQVVVSYCFGEL